MHPEPFISFLEEEFLFHIKDARVNIMFLESEGIIFGVDKTN
jgi:hypothetical protein